MARRISGSVAAAAAFMAVVTLTWRFLTFTGFSNDHYVHVALAQQLLLGERPVRDFLDPGMPLMYVVSASAQLLGGGYLGTEFAVVAVGLALAAAFTVVTAHRLAASLGIAVLITLIEVLAYPRTYSYPKLLAYAVAARAMLAVAERPTRRRIVLLAAVIVLAFLFRHDHGVYIGVASAVCVALATRAQGWQSAARHVATLSAATAVLMFPWLVFIALNGGIVPYFRGGIDVSRAEAVATTLHYWPWLQFVPGKELLSQALDNPANAEAWLFWMFWTLPLLCGAILHLRTLRGRERWPGEGAIVGALVVLAVLVNAALLRDTLRARLADAVVPVALLGAWALGLAWGERWRGRTMQGLVRIAMLVLVIVSVAAFGQVAGLREQFERSSIGEGIRGVWERAAQASALLAMPHRQDVAPASRYAKALIPFFAYLDRCTWPADRIVVTSLMPEVLVMAGRGFGGGTVALVGSYLFQTGEARTIERLQAESVPFALTIDNYEAFRRQFGRIAAYLIRDYEPMVDIPVEGLGPPGVRVLVRRDRPSARTDPETGWRCFR